MEIKQAIDGNKAVFAIDGWLDTQTAPDLSTALNGLADNIDELVFDFTELEYVSSAGIRQIVAAHKKMNGKLVIRNASPEVLEVLKLTGVSKRLSIE